MPTFSKGLLLEYFITLASLLTILGKLGKAITFSSKTFQKNLLTFYEMPNSHYNLISYSKLEILLHKLPMLQTSTGTHLFRKKPLGRHRHLMSSFARSETANLVPLRLERSESAASLE